MNRRKFLQSLFAVGMLTAVNTEKAIKQLFTETELMSDNEFVTYIHFSMNLFVSNPAQSAILTNIVE